MLIRGVLLHVSGPRRSRAVRSRWYGTTLTGTRQGADWTAAGRAMAARRRVGVGVRIAAGEWRDGRGRRGAAGDGVATIRRFTPAETFRTRKKLVSTTKVWVDLEMSKTFGSLDEV